MPNVVIVTGLSGSGKTSALNALEDMGWFAIDNLPVTLLPKVLELAGGQEPMSRIAVGVDARDHRNIDEAGTVIDRLREASNIVHVVYLDASDGVLMQRFSATRRRHPPRQHRRPSRCPREGTRNPAGYARAQRSADRHLTVDCPRH